MISLIKMIVLDLDGTLLNSERKVSERSKNYLKKLKDMGYIIVIATGRIYESINHVMNGFDCANYVITDTGSSCYDISNDHIIFNNPIDLETAKKFINTIMVVLIIVNILHFYLVLSQNI